MKKTKKGRGALVRRLRREYGLTEGETRVAAAGGPWGVDAPDLTAAQTRDDKRSRARDLQTIHPRESFAGFRGDNCCPDLFLDWYRPDDSRPPVWPRRPGMGSGRSRLRTLNLAGGR